MDLQNERYYFSRKKTYVAAYRSGQKERQYSRKSSSQSKTAPPPDIFLGFLKYFSSENYCCAYSLLLFCAAIWCFLRLLVFLACRCCLTTYDIEENPLSLDFCGYDFTSNDCYIMKLFARQQQVYNVFSSSPSHYNSFPCFLAAGCCWLHAEPLGEIDLEVESSLLSYISSRNFPEEVSNLSFYSPIGRKVGLFEIAKNEKAP